MTNDVDQVCVLESTDVENKLNPPLKPIQVFFLSFFTFGLYACYFYYIQAKDLNAIQSEKKLKPWLWIFSPLIAITLPFSTGTMTGLYQKAGTVHGLKLKNRGRSLGGMFLLTLVLGSLVEKIWGEELLFTLIIPELIIAFLLSLICVDVNSYKLAIADTNYKSAAFKVPLLTVILACLGGIFVLAITGLSIYELSNRLSRDHLENGAVFTHETLPFTLEPKHDGWGISEIGTLSDGSADLELGWGASITMIVFDQSQSDIWTISDFRRNVIREADSDATCGEKHFLREPLIRVTELSCSSKGFGNQEKSISTTFDNGTYLIEFYSTITSTGKIDVEDEKRVNQLLSSFQYQQTEKSN